MDHNYGTVAAAAAATAATEKAATVAAALEKKTRNQAERHTIGVRSRGR